MDILYLSHCVPDAPNKGEKIRACFWVQELAKQHRVHLVCFARTDAEVAGAKALRNCASVYVEKIAPNAALAKATWGFLQGDCLITGYFRSAAMQEHVRSLSGRVRLEATIVYTVVMAAYAPPEVPVLLDMSDVDSQKWFQYSVTRKPAFLFDAVAKRLRKQEILCAESARRTVLITEQECSLLRSIAPRASATYIENGVDFSRFNPATAPEIPELRGRTYLAFIGGMDYYPNVQAVVWFAKEVWGELRGRTPKLELGIIGRHPSRDVKALGSIPGIWLEDSPPDVVPFLSASAAVIAPLRLARGIQNKVLEGLAMGKTVFSSTPICESLGATLPRGVVHCPSATEFIERITSVPLEAGMWDPGIRNEAETRFSWPRAMERLREEMTVIADPAVGLPL